MGLAHLADGELARLLPGERAEDAFTVLYERYVRPVHDFVARTVRELAAAEDITQRAFIQAWEQRASLRDPDAVKPWLYRIAGNLALNHVTRSRPVEDIDDLASIVEATAATPEEQALAKEAARLVWDAAASLEPRQRTVLELAVRRQLTSPEVAQVMGVEPAQASLLVHRAKDALGNAVRYLLVARRRTHCPRLAEMVPAGVLQLSAEQRASVDRHMRRCESCQGMASRLTSPEALLGSLVLLPLPASLRRPPHLRLTGATLGGAGASIAGATVPPPGAAGMAPPHPPENRRRRRRAAAVLLAVLLLGTVAGLVVLRAFAGTSPGAGVAQATPGVTPAALATVTPSAFPTSPTPAPAAVARPSASTATSATPRPTPTPSPPFMVTSISLCFIDTTGSCDPANTTAQTCRGTAASSSPGIVAPPVTWQCPFEITFHLTPGRGGTIAWSLAGMLGTGCGTPLTPLSESGTATVPSPAPAVITVTESLPLGTSDPRSSTTRYPRSSATVTARAWQGAAHNTAGFYGTGCG